MSLTAEQWRELDKARRDLRMHPEGPSWWWALATLLSRHHDALIDAARPDCERCAGEGRYPVQRERLRTDCPDCNGTGWAR